MSISLLPFIAIIHLFEFLYEDIIIESLQYLTIAKINLMGASVVGDTSTSSVHPMTSNKNHLYHLIDPVSVIKNFTFRFK